MPNLWIIIILTASALAQTQQLYFPGNGSAVLPNGKYEICSEGIRAQFIPYGATLSNLFIKDAHGVERDIVLGFDNASYYSQSALHPHLNCVPGRYAVRTLMSKNILTFET